MSINHKAASDSYLDACRYDTHAMTNAEKVSLAQVHATRALVEQQQRTADALDALVALGKTANQIAWHAQGKTGPHIRDRIDAAVNS